MSKKTFLLIFIFTSFFILTGSLYYKNLIEQNVVVTINDYELIKKQTGSSYNEIISSVKDYFEKINISYTKKPYKIEDNESSITEEYSIRKIEISMTKLSKFPLRADIFYDYSKKILFKKDNNSELKNGRSLILLLAKEKADSDFIWKNASISLWIIPVIYISVIVIVSLVYTFLIKPAQNKIKKRAEKKAE